MNSQRTSDAGDAVRLDDATAAWREAVLDRCIDRCHGILHLGGHLGQEAARYAAADRPVLWIEAQPDVCAALQRRISAFPRQRALCALLDRTDDHHRPFHISNHAQGAASSVYPFGPYAEGDASLWPQLGLTMVRSLDLPTRRLDTLLHGQGIDPVAYDLWVVDLQGAELDALRGAGDLLRHCRAMLIEASTVRVYDGGVQWEDLQTWLSARGFVALWQPARPHDDVLVVAMSEIDEIREASQCEHQRRRDGARLDHLASLDLPLRGHRVLEIGAGIGGDTQYLRGLGCRVTATDAGAVNLYLLRERFAQDPRVEVAPLDLGTVHAALGRFDTVYWHGPLDQLADPVPALEAIAAACDDLLLLETCVSADDADQHAVAEPAQERDQSAHGRGCHPGRAWIWQQLEALFPFVYTTRLQPTHPEFPLDWTAPAPQGDLRRALFVASRHDLAHNPQLVDTLVAHHAGRVAAA